MSRAKKNGARVDSQQEGLRQKSNEELEREKLIREICCLDLPTKHRPMSVLLQEPVLNFIAVIVGAMIALSGTYLTRPGPDGPPRQAEVALEAWQLQTNPIQQSLIDFMQSWPDKLAKYMECAVVDLPTQDRAKADHFYDVQFRVDEIDRQQVLQGLTSHSPQHVNAEMRIWFGNLDVTEPGSKTAVKMYEYLEFGKGYNLYKDARYKIHEAVLAGRDPAFDPDVQQAAFQYLQRRIRVAELAHAALAKWHADRPRSWIYSEQSTFGRNVPSNIINPRPDRK